MPDTLYTPTHWTPETREERALVLKELDAILASYHFRGSKRYPAFLKYVVDAALDGRSRNLKERTLGVEVFGRDLDYDTNADPVVRFSAGEVRKRIAQYYHENGTNSVLRIELPLGSYVPEFIPQRLPNFDAQDEIGQQKDAHSSASQFPAKKPRRWFPLLGLAMLVLVVCGWAFVHFSRTSTASIPLMELFWQPFDNASRPVLIAIGTSHPHRMAPESPDTSFIAHMTEPYHHVSVSSAVALAHVAGVLQQHSQSYEVKEARETSLTDIRPRPLVLIGATNNTWTMHLVSPLRYHFVFDGKVARIEDAQNPGNTAWSIDFSEPFTTVTTDYAIVARFHDATTEGPVMVVAGLGPYGTEAASEFVESPHYLDQVLKTLPAGWENNNLEIVIKSDVIDNKGGPPMLLATDIW